MLAIFLNFAHMKTRRFPTIVTVTLLLIALASAALDYFLPQTGDDLSFWYFLGLDDYTLPNRKSISFILAHIFGCNGRIFDYMGPVIINLLPRAIAAAVMGAMGGLFFFSILLASGVPKRNYAGFAMGMILFTLAVMPWWDSLWMRVCQFNYTWGTTFCLLTIYLFFQEKEGGKRLTFWALALLGVCAGGAHEQTGVAMSAAFVLWGIYHKNYKSLTYYQKALAGGLFFGTFLTIAAPAIWHRAAEETHHEPITALILTTLPLFAVLLAVILVCLTFRRGRGFIKVCAAENGWSVIVMAGAFSAVVALASGIPGRTGIFSEACAIVALSQMLLHSNCRIRRVGSGILCSAALLLVIAHFAVSIATERKLYGEHEEMVKAYAKSADGVIYQDFTSRYEVSPLTLNRVKGLPDADDAWSVKVLSEVYRTDGHPLIVLPTAFRGTLDSLTDSIAIGRTTVYATSPSNTGLTTDSLTVQYYPGPDARVISRTTLADGRPIWVATPWVRDPGDYELPLLPEE